MKQYYIKGGFIIKELELKGTPKEVLQQLREIREYYLDNVGLQSSEIQAEFNDNVLPVLNEKIRVLKKIVKE